MKGREGKGWNGRGREGRKKKGRKEKKKDYIFQYHQQEVKTDKLRNNGISLSFRNTEGNYQEWLKVKSYLLWAAVISGGQGRGRGLLSFTYAG